jgi:alpha-tubulin suppressor-like RCC1 family protein
LAGQLGHGKDPALVAANRGKAAYAAGAEYRNLPRPAMVTSGALALGPGGEGGGVVSAIACGGDHCLALLEGSAMVVAWGFNRMGQCIDFAAATPFFLAKHAKRHLVLCVN